ncbi:MAG: hypothetical protein Q4G51_13830 [Dermatophilus congolensis]|nr:hypothetical protein [Dermatophilus congolensis]
MNRRIGSGGIPRGRKVHGRFVMNCIDETAHMLITQWTGNPEKASNK